MSDSPIFTTAQCAPRALTFGVGAAAMFALGGALVGLLLGKESQAVVPLVAAVPGLAVLIYCLAIFRCLRVDVHADRIELAFGARAHGGLRGPRRRVPLERIVSVRPGRSRAIYGWGMRWVPGGRLWNVWGLDVVELVLANGKRLLIGTDRPIELADAIGRAVSALARPP
jgi:hypothetical protein